MPKAKKCCAVWTHAPSYNYYGHSLPLLPLEFVAFLKVALVFSLSMGRSNFSAFREAAARRNPKLQYWRYLSPL
jgi:hypothetical protein